MAPEISIEGEMLDSPCTDDLKAIDVWALLITFLVILNPDQRFPLHLNIKETASTEPVDRAFNRLLRKRIIPQFSKDHLPFQAEHYQQLQAVFCEKLPYDPKKRCNIDKIKEMIAEKEHNISYVPLSRSQATALEQSDRIVAKQQTTPKSPALPVNDGTNACSFLALGIIDSLEMISHKLVNDHTMTGENNLIPVLQERVFLVIREFPKSFNRLCNMNEVYAVDEAYSILNSYNLLKRSYEFIDKSTNNYTIYSHEFQFESRKVLEETRGRAVALKQSQSLIFHTGIYIFAMCFVPNGEIIILETHLIQEELHGNGNGLLVVSKSVD